MSDERPASAVLAVDVPPAPRLAPQPPRQADVAELEYELKFALPAGRARPAGAWLRALCRPDDEFPDADVWTVYYDTPDGSSLGEKRNSDYLKTKLRVRWYGEPGGPPAGPVFAEVKSRIGSRRLKARTVLPWRADEMAGRPLTDPAFAGVVRRLGEVPWPPGARWDPVLQLRYRRQRFREPMSGTRVSLDEDLVMTAFHPARICPRDLGPLPFAVLEVKGAAEALPVRLGALIRLGARRMSVSKYAAVYEHARRDIP